MSTRGATMGIERVSMTPVDPLDCNVFVVRGERRSLLVDAGAGRSAIEPPAGVDAVVITHLHADHAGGAAALAARGLRVLADPWTAEGLAVGDESRAGLEQARDWGLYPSDHRLPPCPTVEPLEDGEGLDLGGCTVTALSTPGHADGHLALLVEARSRRAAVCGDLVFAGGRIVAQPLPDCRLDRMWESIERIAALRPDGLHPGHGAEVPEGAGTDLSAALADFRVGCLPPSFETTASPQRA